MDATTEAAFRVIAAQLDRWANESIQGGWSTHQVKPQRDLARLIYSAIGKKDAREIVRGS